MFNNLVDALRVVLEICSPDFADRHKNTDRLITILRFLNRGGENEIIFAICCFIFLLLIENRIGTSRSCVVRG